VREAVRGLSATRQIHSLSMDAQTYHFIEGGLPEFAEVAAPPAEKREELAPAARPGTAALPAQRRDQPARPLGASSPTRPAPGVARPIAAPVPRPTPGRKFRPGPKPAPGPAAAQPPPSRVDWKRPAGSGAPSRPPRPQTATSGRPPAWRGKDGDTRPSGRARPGSRPPRPAERSFSRPGARAGGRPRAGGGAPPAGRRDRPGDFAPRPRPGQKSGLAQRPPRGPGDSPFRGPHRDRPAASAGASGIRGAEPFRPRAPRGVRRPNERRPSEPGRKPSYRPLGRPPASAVNRPSGPAGGRAAASFRPRGEQRSRPPAGGGPPAGGSRERGARPGASYSRPDGQKFPPKGPGAKSNSGRSNQAAGSPFAPKPKPWSRAGNAGQRSRADAGHAKPPASFRRPRPDRKKPGA
jgi:hypothetical protein